MTIDQDTPLQDEAAAEQHEALRLGIPDIAPEAAAWLAVSAFAGVISRNDHAPAFVSRLAKVSLGMGIIRTGDALTEFFTVKEKEEYSPNLFHIAGSVADTVKKTAQVAKSTVKFAFNIEP